jgi:hypothetical protein
MIKDYFASKGWLTKYAQAEDSRGMWQKYVAEVQRSEMDNFNTPDLDQGADSILRPGQTLEDDFDVSFRKANAEGGRIGFNEGLSAKQKKALTITYPKSNKDLEIKKTSPVNKPGAWKTAKKTLLNRYLEGLPEGYLEDYKKLFLNDRGDGTFSKKASVERGITEMEKKYGNILKTLYPSRQKNASGKNFLDARIIDVNSAILQDLRDKGSVVSGLPDAKIVREVDSQIVGKWKPTAPKGKATHHFMPLAGIEGESINLSSTKNTAFIDKKLNSDMSPYDKKLKANQKEQIKLLQEKPTGYKIRIQQLNYKAKNIYKEAGKKVPGSKGYLGYSQIEIKPDGTYDIKVTGIDSNKSFSGLKGEEIIYKNISAEDKIKVQKIADLTSELGGKEKLNQLLFKGGGTEVERGLVQRIISGGGKFALSMLNPAEMIKIKNLIGPGALGIMAAFEAGVVTDDVLRMGKPLNESLASNWLFKSFRPHSEEFEKQRNLLQSGKLNDSQKQYALEMMKMEEILKENNRITMMEDTQLLDQGDAGMIDGSPMIPQEKIDDLRQKLTKRFDRVNDYVFVEGSGRQLENEAEMTEKEATQMGKKAFSPLFGNSGTRLENKAPRPKNMTRGPMTEKGKMALDFSIPGITNYKNTFTPSDKAISDYYQTKEKPRALNPGEGTLMRMGMGGEGLYGTQEKFNEGGLANLMKKYYDKR